MNTRPQRSRTWPGLLATATGIALLCTAAYAQAPRDLDVTIAIETEFRRDQLVPFNRVEVATQEGIVTLSGTVSNLASRSRAEQLSATVKGVRSVINRIEVDISDRTADAIRADVLDALEVHGGVDRISTDVRVSAQGVVTLEGQVESWAERELAVKAAETVAGVTRVESTLAVDQSLAFRGEREIRDDIESRMNWDVRVDDSLVEVLVKDGGRVALSGTVGSLAEKQLAEQLAWVEGVSDVDARALDVERWARDEDLRRNKYVERTDAEVRAALIRAMAYDPRVPDVGVDIRVEEGTVWLRGFVADILGANAAERGAYNTVGVERVINNLKVRPALITDSALNTTVYRALKRFDGLANDTVDVSVTDGRVVVDGDVDSLLELWHIDETVRAVDGVETFVNRLTVNGEEPLFGYDLFTYFPRRLRNAKENSRVLMSDREIHRNLESELFWSPFVDSDSVDFEVDDGIVELHGIVESPLERRAARENALDAGAVAVRDELLSEASAHE